MPNVSPRTDDVSGTGHLVAPDPGTRDSDAVESGPQESDTDGPSPANGASTTAPPTAASEPRHRRGPGHPSALATFGRDVGLAAVGLASIAVGLLSFTASASITKLSVADAAFRFDTTWIYRIAEHGYLHRTATSATDYGGLRVAFFPGLPLLERAVHALIGGGPAHTTVLVGAAGVVVSCLVLWSLVSGDFDERTAWRSVVLLAFFPGAYVFSMAYSESLAIPLALCTLWALRRRWFLVAGLAAALAGAVRLNSVILIAVCAVGAGRYLLEKDRRTETAVSAAVCPFVALLGLIGYVTYLKSSTGDAFAFSSAEKLGWQDDFSVLAPFHDLRLFFDTGFHGAPFVIMNGIGVIAVVAAVALVVSVSMPLEYKIFGVGVLASWLFTTNSGAWFRYVEFAFPVAIAVAAKVPEKFLLPLVSVCAAALGVLTVLFASSTAFFP
jgi:hypothetical protein